MIIVSWPALIEISQIKKNHESVVTYNYIFHINTSLYWLSALSWNDLSISLFYFHFPFLYASRVVILSLMNVLMRRRLRALMVVNSFFREWKQYWKYSFLLITITLINNYNIYKSNYTVLYLHYLQLNLTFLTQNRKKRKKDYLQCI